MKSAIQQLISASVGKMGMRAVVAAATLAVAPTAVFAVHRDSGLRIGIDIHAGPTIERVPVPPPPLPATAYEERQVQVWVEPVYRTVSARQWVPAFYRTVVERVLVPERCEYRDVVRFEHGWRRVHRERVVVQPARYEDVSRQELVCAGHWETTTRQEQVTPGYYETRIERVPVAPVPCP